MLTLTKAFTLSGRNKHRNHPIRAPQSCPTTNTLGAHGVQHSDHVAHHVEIGVTAAIRRRLRVNITAEVRSHGSVAEMGQSLDLVAPAVPQRREAMDEESDWTLAFLCYVNVYSIYPHSPMLYPHHYVKPKLRCFEFGFYGTQGGACLFPWKNKMETGEKDDFGLDGVK